MGGDIGNEIGGEGRGEVATAVKAFVDKRFLVVRGEDFFFGE